MIKKVLFIISIFLFSFSSQAAYLLLSMDEMQKNHLKAYGIAFWVLQNDIEIEWLLNYRGGSFLIPQMADIQEECTIRGVSFDVIADAQADLIRSQISNPEVNQEIVKLQTAPKMAVYSPKNKQPWDDAVTLVLTYAEIPYVIVYDTEIINGELNKYDWLHLHHEDFTGQYGKFYRSFKNAAWYLDQVRSNEAVAQSLGFGKVSELKRAVATTIRDYTLGGGFLFTMCSGTDSYDIALAAEKVDICEWMFDGDAADPKAQEKIDMNSTIAFKDIQLIMDPMQYEFSNIDGTNDHVKLGQKNDIFTLFEFSAKFDIVPTILTQNHQQVITGFMGQTTSFKVPLIKSDVLILGETKSIGTAKYIHGELGKGQWTFYGGHDPEDYRHLVGDPPTDLNLHPNSPGYRLILNNVLFPAAKKKKQKT
ncbi:MAG: hypothetical protein ACJAUV_001042 [Flavobacteriales bacterium]|jgi:hypothetical protein